jgi:hypothetical protein
MPDRRRGGQLSGAPSPLGSQSRNPIRQGRVLRQDRPGFGVYDSSVYQPGIGTKANLDMGGILEFCSERRFGARLDFGDTIIFFGNNPIGSPTGPRNIGTRNQFQGSFGVFLPF